MYLQVCNPNFVGAYACLLNEGHILINVLTIRSSFSPFRSARLECEFGDVERAMSLFDEQLAAHPQRKMLYVDYINLLLSAGHTSDAE